VNHLVILIPAALLLGLIGLAAFLWSLKSGQYNDLDGAAWRAIEDDEADRPAGEEPSTEPSSANRAKR
jgi:cbb3-type cytochrome oxidase maturation protein